MNLIFSDGHFSWSFVVSCLVLAGVLLGADLVWRRTDTPGKSIAVASVVCAVTGVVAAYLLLA